ncbi:hypothetical protein BKA70DRAFT_1426993 [Coprinopsis sp. MPI-PUGE-AT-0042]|nr:hypothetical protein BKA70DRAFT_1426993 [Coprinopsis sp. MPI-PUGE-AT-0042]
MAESNPPVGGRHVSPGTSMRLSISSGISSGGANRNLATPPIAPMTASYDLETNESESLERMPVAFVSLNFLDDPLDIEASGPSTFPGARPVFGTTTTMLSSTISSPRSRNPRVWRTDLSTSPSTLACSFEPAPVLEFLEILPELNVPQSRMIGEVYSSHEAADYPTSPSTLACSFESDPMLEVLEIFPEFNIPQAPLLVNQDGYG